MDFYEIPGTARASFSVYNTVEDVIKLELGLKAVLEVLGN
jgi:selenocysteine lyase/cysteine desulfurase